MSTLIINPWVANIITAIALLQAAFSVGAILMIGTAYIGDPRSRHILAVSAGHVLLITLASHSMAEQLYLIYPWRLPITLIAFCLVDYSLVGYYKKAREKNQHTT